LQNNSYLVHSAGFFSSWPYMAQDRSISPWIIWQLLAALQGGCVAGETMMQRATRRSDAAWPISERQVPSLDDEAAELMAGGILIEDRAVSVTTAEGLVVFPEAISFGDEGEQAARLTMASRARI
jgi:hypothetical protein